MVGIYIVLNFCLCDDLWIHTWIKSLIFNTINTCEYMWHNTGVFIITSSLVHPIDIGYLPCTDLTIIRVLMKILDVITSKSLSCYSTNVLDIFTGKDIYPRFSTIVSVLSTKQWYINSFIIIWGIILNGGALIYPQSTLKPFLLCVYGNKFHLMSMKLFFNILPVQVVHLHHLVNPRVSLSLHTIQHFKLIIKSINIELKSISIILSILPVFHQLQLCLTCYGAKTIQGSLFGFPVRRTKYTCNDENISHSSNVSQSYKLPGGYFIPLYYHKDIYKGYTFTHIYASCLLPYHPLKLVILSLDDIIDLGYPHHVWFHGWEAPLIHRLVKLSVPIIPW